VCVGVRPIRHNGYSRSSALRSASQPLQRHADVTGIWRLSYPRPIGICVSCSGAGRLAARIVPFSQQETAIPIGRGYDSLPNPITQRLAEGLTCRSQCRTPRITIMPDWPDANAPRRPRWLGDYGLRHHHPARCPSNQPECTIAKPSRRYSETRKEACQFYGFRFELAVSIVAR